LVERYSEYFWEENAPMKDNTMIHSFGCGSAQSRKESNTNQFANSFKKWSCIYYLFVFPQI
jgi:hypothetical protein